MTDWLPSLNALRAFEAVARHLSYRSAAEELKVTPAAVKQLVQKLEATLDLSLIRRHGRGLALTPAGEIGLAELGSAFTGIASAVARWRRLRERPALTISVEPSFATAWLVSRLDSFKGLHPAVDVLIDSTMRIVDLRREAVDIAIRYGVESGKDEVAHRLYDDQTLAVCSPALAKGPPPLKALRDLEQATLLHMDLSQMQWISVSSHWFDWRTWLADVGGGDIEPGRGLRFNDYNLAIQAAIAGQGVVLGSWPIVRQAIQAGLLVSPFAERSRLGVGYDLVTTKAALARPEVSDFVNWILSEVES